MMVKGLLDVGEWWSIVEICHDVRDFKIMLFSLAEKGHQALVDDEILWDDVVLGFVLLFCDVFD